MPIVARESFLLALKNISSRGDTDIFPFPIENHVVHDCVEEMADLLVGLSEKLGDQLLRNPPANYSTLAPAGYNGFRWATQIDPLWNAYFLGCVLSLAPSIEQSRVSADARTVFSYRYKPDDVTGNLFADDGWTLFQARSAELANEHSHVVLLDIADFYSRVYHHRIENQLKYVDTSGQRAGLIVKVLTQFSQGVSYGLPVGGPASRILAELLLDAVDQLLVHQVDMPFLRYADDYRFFVDSERQAFRVIGFLSEKLQRNEGLSLQKSKTRIMTSKEYLTTIAPTDPRPGSAAKFLSLHLYFDPYSATAEEDYEVLRERLEEFDVLGLLRAELFKGRVDTTLTKRLVSALRLLPPPIQGQAIQSLLENVDTLGPILPHVLRAIRGSLDGQDDDSQDTIHAAIRKLISEQHPLAQLDLNLQYMVRILAQRKLPENERLLTQLYATPHGYTQAPAPGIQRDITLAASRWGLRFWLHDRKSHYQTMHPWVQRAFFVASYSLGDEGSYWRKTIRGGLSPFAGIVADWSAKRAQQSDWQIPL